MLVELEKRFFVVDRKYLAGNFATPGLDAV